ncbi:facilitated trehalose transporter Tret1-like isoform X1 [Anopheles albimanus]|uniref:facilitated trehalose transporter Tret1-like isoform X1 n=1 Tax=Anopheles albimanus TaxID=7167 RepID=UPI00163E64C6|nr:facilitated trehalose transporter Tret1-like isoform X1 [Anopheles albimanus]
MALRPSVRSCRTSRMVGGAACCIPVSPRGLAMHPLTFASIRNQFLGTFAVNIIALAHGGVLGWVSPSLAYLQSNETHLAGGPLTVEQTSWLGSSLCIGGMVGVTLFGLLADYVGKRKALQCITVPHVAFWLCVLFGRDVYQLCLGRVFAGTAGGGLIRIVPLYVAEIADCRIRGDLGSLLPICFNAGTVLAFIVGGLVSFGTMPLVLLVLPALFLLAMIVLPDTPACLLRSLRNEQAERSLMFYRGVASQLQKTDQFLFEFKQLSDAIEREKTEPNAGLWKDFASGPGRRGLAMAVFLMFLNQCSGSLALITYAATIFEMAAGGDRTAYQLPPAIAPIVLATVQLIGTIVSLVLVDRVGRRILLIVSCVGVANGYLTLAAYVQFRPQEATAGAGGSAIALLLPLVSLSFSILLASLGLLTVPFVVMAEILPAKVHPAVRCCFSMAQHTASSLIRLFFWSPFGVTSCGLGTLEPQQIAPFVRACVCVCARVCLCICVCVRSRRRLVYLNNRNLDIGIR